MPAAEPWALALFRRSVLKQRKYAEITAALGPTDGLRCLDLGSDNGVVSLLLRRAGGRWASADLTAEAVASIRGLVGTDVHQTDGERLPFADAEFDRVVVVDMLEHVVDDGRFAAELARITRPGGLLVVNTPHLKHSALAPPPPRAGPDGREARPPASRLRPRTGWAPCSRPRFTLQAGITPTRASSPSWWTPPSTRAWACSASAPRPREWW